MREPYELYQRLTIREREILSMLPQSLSVKQIARDLSLSRFTINQHIRSVYLKIGATNRIEAVVFYLGYLAHQGSTSDGTRLEDGKSFNCSREASADPCRRLVCMVGRFCEMKAKGRDTEHCHSVMDRSGDEL